VEEFAKFLTVIVEYKRALSDRFAAKHTSANLEIYCTGKEKNNCSQGQAILLAGRGSGERHSSIA